MSRHTVRFVQRMCQFWALAWKDGSRAEGAARVARSWFSVAEQPTGLQVHVDPGATGHNRVTQPQQGPGQALMLAQVGQSGVKWDLAGWQGQGLGEERWSQSRGRAGPHCPATSG